MPSVPILELHLEVSVREDNKIYFLLTLKAQFMQTKVFREEEGGNVIKHLQRQKKKRTEVFTKLHPEFRPCKSLCTVVS